MNAIPALAVLRLQLGQIVATPGALDAINARARAAMPALAPNATPNERAIAERVTMQDAAGTIKGLIRRHAAGDWGDLDADDKAANDAALLDGSRVLSAYALTLDNMKPLKVWIITEADRSATLLLLPSEY